MKIRTNELITKYETWEYDIDKPLPEDFLTWDSAEQYEWLIGFNGELIDSEFSASELLTTPDILI